MEGHVAFHLLHDLVDVPVQHSDGPETLQEHQGLHAVIRAPTPIGIDGPQRDMGENDDRRAVGFALEIVG